MKAHQELCVQPRHISHEHLGRHKVGCHGYSAMRTINEMSQQTMGQDISTVDERRRCI